MSNRTNNGKNDVLNVLFTSGLYSTKSFCLFTGGSGIQSDLATGGSTALAHELNSTGYSRVTKIGGTPFGTASNGSITTNEDIKFAINSGGSDWPSISHWGMIIDGDLKMWGALTTPRTVQVGQSIKFNPGDLTVSVS